MLCDLCQNEPKQEDSHIIPAFVFRYLKATSPTGFFRGTDEPNRRVQDGPKCKLLGPACEDYFAKYEKIFSEEIFHPVHRLGKNDLAFEYEDWLGKFCVSLSWRALAALMKKGVDNVPFGHGPLLQPALNTWRDFLLGKKADVGCHKQHFLILGDPTSSPSQLDGTELALYIQRATDYNTMHAENMCYVMTKMCRIVVVGTILPEQSNPWANTEVNLQRGKYAPGDFGVSSLLFSFFESAIAETKEGRQRISGTQSDTILKTFERKHGPLPKRS
jgi:hypothetical protein